MNAKQIIGIDLGTTYSLASVLAGDSPVLIPNVLGEHLTPSVVSIDDDGRVLVGAAARARRTTHPEQTAATFKRDMGTHHKVSLDGQTRSAEELSAYVLAALKADAEAFLGAPVEEAVITVPAYFGELQRQATRAAGEIAGLKVERIINEPTAAALAYGLHNLDRELRAVVLDLGGGTFDVTVLEIMEGVIEIQASAGDSRLGGEDFSEALASSVIERLERAGSPVARDARTLARIHEAAEQAKRRLSDDERTLLVAPDVPLAGGGTRDVELEVTRDEAEVAWRSLIKRVEGPIHGALRDAGVSPSDVDEVLLVGGSTRMPCVARLCSRLFGRLPRRDLPPDEGVAMGAAVQAALKAGEEAVEDLVVTDVAPFSMGIASATKVGSRLVEGLFSPILERGTVIPASRVETFHTITDHQVMIEVEVFQGEHATCQENTRLGAYKIRGIPRGPAGSQSIDVRFTYDLNGLLEVETTINSTGDRHHLMLEQRPGNMTKGQIAAARARMAKLKFHPRETLPNRAALSRADSLYAELRGDARAALADAIGVFRGALDAQDPELIDQARAHLVALTQQLRNR